MGFVLIAAFLEWFLWLAAFEYCLIKVYQKANTWTVKVLAVIMMVLFFSMRYLLNLQ
jgi:chitin synthase